MCVLPMSPTRLSLTMLFWSCLLTCLALCHGFFLPSFSSQPTQPKKSDVPTLQWPPYMRDSVIYGQHYAGQNGGAHHGYVAVPYPVAIPAPAPPPAPVPQQIGLQLSQSQAQAAAGSTVHASALAYHNMQLVPCLCSVPKEDLEDVTVQNSQQLTNNNAN